LKEIFSFNTYFFYRVVHELFARQGNFSYFGFYFRNVWVMGRLKIYYAICSAVYRCFLRGNYLFDLEEKSGGKKFGS